MATQVQHLREQSRRQRDKVVSLSARVAELELEKAQTWEMIERSGDDERHFRGQVAELLAKLATIEAAVLAVLNDPSSMYPLDRESVVELIALVEGEGGG